MFDTKICIVTSSGLRDAEIRSLQRIVKLLADLEASQAALDNAIIARKYDIYREFLAIAQRYGLPIQQCGDKCITVLVYGRDVFYATFSSPEEMEAYMSNLESSGFFVRWADVEITQQKTRSAIFNELQQAYEDFQEQLHPEP